MLQPLGEISERRPRMKVSMRRAGEPKWLMQHGPSMARVGGGAFPVETAHWQTNTGKVGNIRINPEPPPRSHDVRLRVDLYSCMAAQPPAHNFMQLYM